MESDIDQFIRNQKVKLQQERQQLADDERGERVGRRQWEDPGRETQYAEQNDYPRKTDIDYKEWELSFQKDKKKSYNDHLEQLKHRTRKQPTPPGSGMKFGEYEEYRKKIDRQRKQDYKADLQKQQEEQMLLKAHRDFNEIAFLQTSPRIDPTKVKLDHEISDKIMNQKFKEFDKMMAVNKKPDQQRVEQERFQTEKQAKSQPWQEYEERFQRNPPEAKSLKEFDEQFPRNRPEEQTQPQFERPSEPSNYLDTYTYQKHQERLKAQRQNESKQFFEQQAQRGKRSKGAQLREERALAQAQPQIEERAFAQAQPQIEERAFTLVQPEVLEDRFTVPQRQDPEPSYNRDGRYDPTRQLQEAKEREYYDLVNQLQQGREDNTFERPRVDQRQEKERESYREQLPPKPPTPGGMFNKLGAHDRQRNKLNEERREEYNKLITEPGDRRGRSRPVEPEREYYEPEPEPIPRPSTDEGTGASLKGLNPRDSAEIRKKQIRNDEYNEFLRQKGGRNQGRQTEGRPPLPLSAKNPREKPRKEDVYATLPGLHYSDSADKRKMAQRNKEYNEMLQNTGGKLRRSGEPPEPRRGWQSPSYEEILDRKRQEETEYRREDPGFSGMRAYNSEGAIDSLGNDRYKELDREYETRKVRFRDQRSNILEDDQWLDADQARRNAQFSDLMSKVRDSPQAQPPPPAAPRGPPPKEGPSQQEMATTFLATLPVGSDRGGNERDSAKRRRQSKYREELQLQMQETAASKRREKVEDLRVNASGLLDPEKTSRRLVNLGKPDITPRRNIRSPEVRAYHTKFDLTPRSGRRGQDVNIDLYGSGGYPSERGRPSRRDRGRADIRSDGGLLDTGFEGLLDRPRAPPYIPPGVQYTPSFADPNEAGRLGGQSSYITGGAGYGGLGNELTSIDQAYHNSANRNLLEPEGNGGYIGHDIPLNRLDDGGYRDRMSPPRVSFEDNTRNRSRSRDRISPYHFAGEDDGRSKSRQDAKEYQHELESQIQEKRYREKKAKEEKARYERKLEDEIRNYNPFGRAGGGAPNKDNYGNAVTDLRSMHNVNQDSARSPPPRESPRFRAPADPSDDLHKPPPVQQNTQGENTYARGGHGFFGNPKTDAEKTQADKYKEDLRLQIEEKKRAAQLEREKEKIEEEKENRRLEEQRIRIQHEFEEEVRKKREKEEEGRRKNEEMRQQAEDRKKEEQRKRQEASEAKSRERQEEQERERLERQQDQRGSSPPIPAVKSKMATENGEPSTSDARGNSPPVPSLRSKTDEPKTRPPPSPVQRAASSDVLKELATMRKQLQNERKRVENALEQQQNKPDIFDPRVVQRPPPRDIDVFERAKQGHAAVPQRTTDTANAKTLKDFNDLKYHNDTASRQALRNMYPDIPSSGSALEVQQIALLRHQEDQLKNMKDSNYGTGRQLTLSPKSLLNSNSAFIDYDNVGHYPDDFEDLPKQNGSARQRRRERIGISPRPESLNLNLNPMGSTTSLDVDRIQKKNDARLRRLHNMNTDEVSNADPDEILDRFMAKQRHNRPPSGQTLQDDSWLNPAGGNPY